MNTAKRTLLSAAIAAALICCCSIKANAMVGGQESSNGTVNVPRTEAVDMYLMPTTDTVNTWHRVIRATSDARS